jgi:hypothetical protein
MSDVLDFVAPIKDFSTRPTPFVIEAFSWYLHEVEQRAHLTSGDIGRCFDDAHLPRPANIASSLAKLCERKPARMIRDSNGYRLSIDVRTGLAALLPVRATSVKATRLLEDLTQRISQPMQKTFLEETLVCFRHGAYRASIVMAWNLVFSDLLDRVLEKHLPSFNSQVGTHGFKHPIRARDQFADLKESQIIAIARAARILSKEVAKVLEEKLSKRNTAAHPSTVAVSVTTAEEVIFDLVQNVLLTDSF